MNSHKPTPVAFYLRVSGEEQAQAGTLEKNQHDYLRRYAELNGLEVYGVYADGGVSGVIPLAQRPEGARLLEDARRGQFGQVLVYRLDRLARLGLIPQTVVMVRERAPFKGPLLVEVDGVAHAISHDIAQSVFVTPCK